MSLKAIHSLASTITDFSGLTADLPGRVTCSSEYNAESDEHLVTMIGYDPNTGDEVFDSRVAFCFGDKKESRIKNFSIHDPKQRGQGIGAKVVANLLDVTRAHDGALEKISLTAELERGAMVWLKMGWLPDQTSFTKLQKKCLPKIDTLQQLLPQSDRLSSTTYGIFRDILDHESTSDPQYAWAIVDSNASYSLKAMRDLQDIANIADPKTRLEAISERAKSNGVNYSPADAAKADKSLVFIRNLDLDNLSREGKIKVCATLLAWESWKGTLRLDNEAQVGRLESALDRGSQRSTPIYDNNAVNQTRFDTHPYGEPHA